MTSADLFCHIQCFILRGELESFHQWKFMTLWDDNLDTDIMALYMSLNIIAYNHIYPS